MTFRYVKSVCHSSFGRRVGWANRSAARIRMNAGLVMRSAAVRMR
jgi:hypothetical protein